MIHICVVDHTCYTVYYGGNKKWPIFVFLGCLRVRFNKLLISW